MGAVCSGRLGASSSRVRLDELEEAHDALEEANGALQAELKKLKAEAGMLRGRLADFEQGHKGVAAVKRRIPEAGDHVISHHYGHNYYAATVVRWDSTERQFEVAWDDGDKTGTLQRYDLVCLDVAPSEDEVAISTTVMFPQGTYHFATADGVTHSNLQRFHEGRVTSIERDAETGEKVYVGVHMRTEEDNKFQRYGGYAPTFRCTLGQMRVTANLLDLITAEDHGDGAAEGKDQCDIYLSFAKKDLESAKTFGEARAADPTQLAEAFRKEGWRVYYDPTGGDNAEANIAALANAKVFVACVSDAYAASSATRQELQYAMKTLKKEVVPLVVGEASESFDFMSTLIGLLIAGELYIDFRARTRHEEKLKEAKHCLRTLIEMEHGAELTVGTGERDNARDVFVSYCWHNSALAVEAMQVPQLYGNALIDPRRVAKAIKAAGLSTWLDIEELGSGSGLFEDIAAGLKEAKVVVICASSAYSRSDNCRMEMQYATKLLKKPAVLLVVDADEAWKQTVVGLLGGSLPTVDLASALTNGGEAGCDKAMAEIVKLVRTAAGEKSAKEGTSATVHPAEQPAAQPSGPQVGDAVISHHIAHTFYNATVVSFDKGSREFEVAWQDGDTTHTTQQFDRVFLDVEPDADEVGVGTRVLFPQGRYTYNGVSCARYNEGVITALEHDGEETFYAGKHAFGESDGKFFFRDQSPTFRCSLGQLRVAANLMAALMTADSDVRLPTGAANLAA